LVARAFVLQWLGGPRKHGISNCLNSTLDLSCSMPNETGQWPLVAARVGVEYVFDAKLGHVCAFAALVGCD